MTDYKPLVQEFLSRAVAVTGITLSEIAARVGVSPSTLTRPANGEVKHLMSLRTAYQVSEMTGVPIPQVTPSNPAIGEVLKDRFEVAWINFWRRLDERDRETIFRTMRIDPPDDVSSRRIV